MYPCHSEWRRAQAQSPIWPLISPRSIFYFYSWMTNELHLDIKYSSLQDICLFFLLRLRNLVEFFYPMILSVCITRHAQESMLWNMFNSFCPFLFSFRVSLEKKDRRYCACKEWNYGCDFKSISYWKWWLQWICVQPMSWYTGHPFEQCAWAN